MNADPEIFLMANLGSETSRLLHARQERNNERMRGAYARACRILKEIPQPSAAARAELALLAAVLDDLMQTTPAFRIRPESVRAYFLPFALRSLSPKVKAVT